MDTYAAMCDCEEIQGLWKPKGGDIVRGAVAGIRVLNSSELRHAKGPATIWLPRQEDIQGMLVYTGLYPTFYSMICDLSAYLRDILPLESDKAPTAEQAWLLFYMKAVHNKRWTGEGWA